MLYGGLGGIAISAPGAVAASAASGLTGVFTWGAAEVTSALTGFPIPTPGGAARSTAKNLAGNAAEQLAKSADNLQDVTDGVADALRNARVNALDNAASAVSPRLTQRLDAFRSYRANGGEMDMARWVKATQGNPAYGTGFNSGFSKWSKQFDGPVHGNSLAATGPHDVYVLRAAGSGELLHFGETGRGFTRRFAEHQRAYAVQGMDIEAQLLRSVDGKAAARGWESRYIDTYIRVFGKRPPNNGVNH
jgi:hypothetical protein